MTKKILGTGVALVTPFDKRLDVDFQGLQKLLAHIADSKVRYLVVHGTTGEAATTTAEEKKSILSFIQTHNTNELPIVYGMGGNNTHEVISTIKKTNWEGIDAVLSISPWYNKPSQAGIYQHYIAVADACPVPILLYNIPTRTGTNITATTTLQLSEHPNIVGIKEASGNLIQCMEIAKSKRDNFLIIAGEDILTLPMMAVGAVGTISSVANGFPKTTCQVVDLALQGHNVAAKHQTLALLPISQLISQAGNPGGTKQMLTVLGICKNYVRPPLAPAPSSLIQELQAAILTQRQP